MKKQSKVNYHDGGVIKTDPGVTFHKVPDRVRKPKHPIAVQCDAIKNMLLAKNKKYGNSALEPIRVFSKADPVEQIKVRIDDKLSRIKTSDPADTEDSVDDLIGYLVLLKVANGES